MVLVVSLLSVVLAVAVVVVVGMWGKNTCCMNVGNIYGNMGAIVSIHSNTSTNSTLSSSAFLLLLL